MRHTWKVSWPGKTCHVFLPMILAKEVAFILRQDVTMLDKQYLLS
jgi:hypothetical protein